MLSRHMASSLVVTSLHGQQSGDAEEHSLMQLDFVSLQTDAIAHATHDIRSGMFSQCRIKSEGENVYILLTFLLRRIIIGGDGCYLLGEAATGPDCGTSTAG